MTEISSDIAATALTGTYSAIGDLGGALKEKSVIVSAPHNGGRGDGGRRVQLYTLCGAWNFPFQHS